jgi:hypothetical protein
MTWYKKSSQNHDVGWKKWPSKLITRPVSVHNIASSDQSGVERRLNMQRLLPKVAQSFLCLLVVLLFSGCGNSYYNGPVTDHFDGRKFDNPWAPMSDRFGDFLKWRLTADRGRWPESVPVTPSTPPVRVTDYTLRVTYVGHCTVLLQTQGLNILTDPIWSERASTLSFAGPKRVIAPGVRFEDLPPIDVVLVPCNNHKFG